MMIPRPSHHRNSPSCSVSPGQHHASISGLEQCQGCGGQPIGRARDGNTLFFAQAGRDGGLAMSESEFWRLIEGTWDAADDEGSKQVARLTKKLSKLSVGEIVAFDEILNGLMRRSCSDELRKVAAEILGGYCSDDGFDYFRAWVIAQGEDVFEQSLTDPGSLVWIADPVSCCELLLYVAQHAYQRKTGEDIGEIWENWPPVRA